MGSNNVKEAGNSPRTGAATPRAHQPQNEPNFELVALGHTADTVANYAQPISVTPLPSNATISILTPQEMSRLGPEPPERPFEQLMQPLAMTDTREISAVVTGIESYRPLAEAISNNLDREIGRDQFTVEECEGGTEFSFNGTLHSSSEAWKRACNLFENLYALGFRSNSLGMSCAAVDLVTLLPIVRQDLSARKQWNMPSEPNHLDWQRRKTCIDDLMQNGYFEAAFILLSDCAKVDLLVIKNFMVPRARELGRLYDFKTDDADPLRALKRGFAWESIYPVQAGRIVLRDVATVDDNSTELEQYQIQAFEQIADDARIFDRAQLVAELLDLPDIDRGDLFRNPKVRFLLLDIGKLEELRDHFDAIDNHYNAIFLKTRKRLEEKFVLHNDFLGTAKIESRSPYTPLSEKSIEQLFQLAEAACVIGFEEEAVAVLEFLAPRNELSDKQRAALTPLAERTLMFARFTPDRQFRTSNFNAVKSRIDGIFLPPNGGGN